MIIDKLKKRSMPKPEIKDSKIDIPVGKWVKCTKCGEIIYKEFLHENLSICPTCNYHFRLSGRRRIWQVIDEGTFKPFEIKIDTVNPLQMEEYTAKLKTLRKINGIDDAIVCGTGKIEGDEVVICVMDGNFMMGSMGTVVGEKITYCMEKAIELKLPIIIFCVSGGARMQEGIMSLMQMAKTTSAVAKLNEAGILYISVLTDPTYGGVTASFATVADVVLAEPGAMIGFTGPRVIKQTIGQELPEGFQTAEFQLEHGFVDKIVDRSEMKETLSKIIKFHK
jgi:acetyl-CoA carboxylase carboxyl transferase subunit beta